MRSGLIIEERGGLEQEEAGDGGGEEVVDVDVVAELLPNHLEAEEATSGVEEREREEHEEGQRPEEDESGGGQHADHFPERVVEVVYRRRVPRQCLPEQGLARQGEAYPEIPRFEAGQELTNRYRPARGGFGRETAAVFAP